MRISGIPFPFSFSIVPVDVCYVRLLAIIRMSEEARIIPDCTGLLSARLFQLNCRECQNAVYARMLDRKKR